MLPRLRSLPRPPVPRPLFPARGTPAGLPPPSRLLSRSVSRVPGQPRSLLPTPLLLGLPPAPGTAQPPPPSSRHASHLPPRSASSPSPLSLGGAAAVSQAEGGRGGGEKGCLEKLPLPARGPAPAPPTSPAQPSPPPNAGARELSGITGVGRRRPRSLQPCRWTPGPGRAPLWLWPERARRLSNPPAPAAPARPALLPRSRARGGPVPSRRAEPGAAERPRRAGGFAHKSAVMMVVLMRPRSSPAELPRTAHEQQRRALPRARDSSTLLTGLGGDPGGQEFGRTLTRCPRWGSRARVTVRRKAGSPAFTYCQATPQILIPHSDPKRCQAHTRRLLSSQEGSSEFGGSCPHSVS